MKERVDGEGVHRLIESQSGRQILVWGLPGCIRYSVQLKDHIIKAEKNIIYI